MEEKTFTDICTISANIAAKSKVTQLRPLSEELFKKIHAVERGVCVLSGIRGSGKTTLLAHLAENEEHTLFISAEALLPFGAVFLDFLHYAWSKGHKILLIDEVHALPEWEKAIKLFYDETKTKIIVSGSSAIALKAKSSELSRRAQFYETKPLSFREYIFLRTGVLLPKISISEIIDAERRKELEKEIMPYLHYFLPYLQFDALPTAVFDKNKDLYLTILERTVHYDLTSLAEIDTYYVDAVFRIIKIIASSPPGETSYSSLSMALGVSIKSIKEILVALSYTGIIYLIPASGSGKKAVRKEEKILMPLSFRAALCSYYGVSVPTGSMREDFFVQHVGHCSYFKTGIERRTPDFVVGRYIFEVGGGSKGYEQIKGKTEAYLVKEGFPAGKKEVPLYLFGLLY